MPYSRTNPSMLASRVAAGLVGVLVCGITAMPLHSQQSGSSRLPEGSIAGSVIDGETSLPLSSAAVVLEPVSAGALPSRSEGTGGFLNATRAVLTDSTGAYRFRGLPPGRYRLRVSRVGYRPASVGVDLHGSADSRVSVGLSVEPISLEALTATAERSDAYGADRSPREDVEGSRRVVARSRQREHLATDARELTHADVLESVTLGETDLFRALQRLPGVSTRDDYTAELWVRGAPWDQTRVLFDGLPLFNPVHAMGLFSGVNPDAIGSALLHPGVRSASLAEGAAGVVDLASRRGGGEGEIRGAADLSLASARLSLDQRILDGRGAWMFAGRRSYLDWLTLGIEKLVDGDEPIHTPYSFSDLVGRFDLRLDEERALEVSGLWERDRITGDLPDVLHRTSARWGNAAARVTYASALRGLRARHTVGVSRYAAITRESDPDPRVDPIYNAPEEPRSDNIVSYAVLSGELTPETGSGSPTPWRLGYELVRQGAHYDGPGVASDQGYSVADTPPLSIESDLWYGVLWGERRWAPLERLTVETGLRLEAGEPVENGGAVRVAPRLTARYALTPDLAFSAGAGRTYQYAQALAPAGPSFHPAFHAGHLWLLAEREVPAIRSDVATLGVEAWMGGGWLASANAYLRSATGVTIPDPSPGPLVERPLLAVGESAAHGLELSTRRLAGRWTASASYTYGRSNMQAAGLRFPAPADRRHAFDATTMVRLGSSFRLGAAYTGMSGAPFTRRVTGMVDECDPSGWCRKLEVPRIEAPNAQRTPAYASLDLLLDWTHAFTAWEIGAYLQVRNALYRDNATTYNGSYYHCTSMTSRNGGETWRCDDPGGARWTDRFEAGLPILPVFGVRAKF